MIISRIAAQESKKNLVIRPVGIIKKKSFVHNDQKIVPCPGRYAQEDLIVRRMVAWPIVSTHEK